MTRWSTSIVRASLVAVLLAAAAAYGTMRTTAQELSEQDVIRDVGYVPMKDGIRLAVVTWRPKQSGRYPTLLSYSPYATGGQPFAQVKPFLEAGYAYVGASIRGTGCSEGTYGLWMPEEGTDGAQLVEWAGTQSWSTGAVGMVGNSYPGHTQIMTASHRPPHLKAIAASGLTASSYREVWMSGGMLNLNMIARWTISGQPRSSGQSAENRIQWGDTECAGIRAKQRPNRAYYEVLEHPLHDEWWKVRDLETMIGKVNVPTLIMHGWQDQQTAANGPLHLYKMLTTPKRMFLMSGGHGSGSRDISRVEAIRWMDRWLKGEKNGVDTEPKVTVAWDVQDDQGKSTPSWKTTYADWPVPNLQRTQYYLTADGKLTREKPGAVADNGARSYIYPTGTELIGDNEQFEVPPASSGSLSYVSEAMADDTALLGVPHVSFFASSEQKDTAFQVTLKDIDPAGNTLFLQRGYLVASLRAIDAAQTTPDEIIQTFKKREELVPGQIFEMKFSLQAIGHVVRRGHKIELTIAAPSPVPQPDWGPLPPSLPSVNKVFHSAQYPSSLTLPIVPGEKAQAPAPRCGGQQFQPCRPGRKST